VSDNVAEVTRSATCEPGSEAVSEVLRLLGRRVWVLNAPGLEGSAAVHQSGDVDCVVDELDASWPLRLDRGWRLCQRLQYNAVGCYWVLENNGQVLAVDTLTDPQGIGPDAFPTTIFTLGDSDPTSAQRAAYLTAKRLRKNLRAPAEWQRIAVLAGDEPAEYVRALAPVLGTRMSRTVGMCVLEGRPPDAALWRRARGVQLVRRFRNPARIINACVRGARRLVERIVRPSGLFVLLAGPDGSGKSTLAPLIPEVCEKLFRRGTCWHSRPAVLPRPGSLLGRQAANTSHPHGRKPHGKVASNALLAYHWLDFMLAGWLRLQPYRTRTGLAVVERGWWDLSVDQRRYRLNVSSSLVRALGRLLPQPDLIVLLEAAPQVLAARKSEIDDDEIARQMARWRSAVPKGVPHVVLDASAPPLEIALQVREVLIDLLERRAVGGLGPGWVGLPRRSQPRWWMPRAPRRSAHASLAVYQPVTPRTLAGWHLARWSALGGAFHLLPRVSPPPRFVRELVAPYVSPGGSFSVASANYPERFIALLLDHRGSCSAVAKVAGDDTGRACLQREGHALSTLASLLPEPLRAPRILAQEQGLLLLEAFDWHPRLHPVRIPEDVARALGEFFGRQARWAGDGPVGPGHGDCAPWNLLQTCDGWALLDWEDASPDAPAFFDLFHHVVQSHILLGKPSGRTILRGVQGHGWIGAAIRAYAQAAGLEPPHAQAALLQYLDLSQARLDLATEEGLVGLRGRRRLLTALGVSR